METTVVYWDYLGKEIGSYYFIEDFCKGRL